MKSHCLKGAKEVKTSSMRYEEQTVTQALQTLVIESDSEDYEEGLYTNLNHATEELVCKFWGKKVHVLWVFLASWIQIFGLLHTLWSPAPLGKNRGL